MTPTTDVTELLPPLRRPVAAVRRPGAGLTVEFAGIGIALVLLAAVALAAGVERTGATPEVPPRASAAAALPQVPAAPAAGRPTAPAARVVPAAAGLTPNVVGVGRDAAAAALLAAGYRSISWGSEPGAAGSSGVVLRQEPAPGSAVQPRGAARLVVAR